MKTKERYLSKYMIEKNDDTVNVSVEFLEDTLHREHKYFSKYMEYRKKHRQLKTAVTGAMIGYVIGLIISYIIL